MIKTTKFLTLFESPSFLFVTPCFMFVERVDPKRFIIKKNFFEKNYVCLLKTKKKGIVNFRINKINRINRINCGFFEDESFRN